MSPIIQISAQQAINYLINRSFLHQKASSIQEVLAQYKCIQVDPIQAVARSHELALWNRVQDFRISDLYSEIYTKHTLFEYWLELYSIIPTEYFPYLRARREATEGWRDGYSKSHAKEIRLALEYIAKHGPTSPKELANIAQSKERLYAWKDGGTRTALLQFLWDTGHVVITHRASNQKYYDLPERVLPKEIITNVVSEQQSLEFILHSSFDYVGILSLMYLARVGSHTRNKVRQLFQQKLDTGEIVQLKLADSKTKYFIRQNELEKLQNSTELLHRGLNILPPLDPLIIDRQMTLDLWGFFYRWEAYTPAAQRKFGYYNMPILYKGDIVGQIDIEKAKNLKIKIRKLESKYNNKSFNDALADQVSFLQQMVYMR